MEDGYELDLTYITERIIAVSFPRACSEETYHHNLQDVTRMLKSKHGDNYLVINLSEKRYDLNKMNPKIMDAGWPDLHAPALDKICTICKAMESWLYDDPQHVVVIHCRGGKGRIGVIISSYVHFTNISASADQALDRFAMRKFYDDKVSALMTPSQKRYVWILSSLLTGSMKMNASLVFLHYIIFHQTPDFSSGGGFRPFLKVYQGMQAVYTLGIHHVSPGYKGRVCMTLEPAQLLKGDIMIKCYQKCPQPPGREVVFRLQFHTGTVHGRRLVFEKEDLEHANTDHRFPDYGKIELVFSEGPEKISGCDLWQNGAEVVVDYNTADPLIRWDSYENITSEGEVPYVQGPVDGGSYAKARKTSLDSTPGPGAVRNVSVTSSPDRSDHTLSTSSDSGLSSTSARTRPGPSRQETAELKRLLSRIGVEPSERTEEMQERNLGRSVRAPQSRPLVERETDILDDEMPTQDHCSVDSIGTLSSSEGQHSNPLGHPGFHKSSQNSLLSDGEVVPELGLGLGLGLEEYERGFPSSRATPASTTHSATPKPQAFGQGGYSTQTWVRQQQMVAQHYAYRANEADATFSSDKAEGLSAAPAVPEVPTRGNSSREAAQRAAGELNGIDATSTREDELASLAVDIDQSIDQLNQLIMDLDPTFVPIPTRANSVRRDGRGLFNRSASLCANGVSHRLDEGTEGLLQSCNQTASPISHLGAGRARSLRHQHSDVTDHSTIRSRQWGRGDPPTSEQRVLYRANSVDYGGQGEEPDREAVPPTPAFPVSPPTPYVKSISEFCQMMPSPQPGEPSQVYGRVHESRGYAESVNRSGASSSEGDPFRSEVSASTGPCQRVFSSMLSESSNSLFSRTESPCAGQNWHDGVSKAPLSQQSSPGRIGPPYASAMDPPTASTPPSHPAPNCHSSPRGGGRSVLDFGLRFEEAQKEPGLAALLEQGLDQMSLAAQPPLPEKRRVSEGEHSLGSGSPCLSGFSSPHSGSTISIPFPSVLPDLSAGASSTSSPPPDVIASKQATVKFVQDTSKFWYKPDISRDQAITVLKDKEPGSFIVRDSHSFRGAYGLAVKVATPPPSVLQQSKKGGDLSNELVRHFLIECTQKGVRLKGCPNEPYFGSLTALVCQHAITPLALPCKLIIPDRDPLEDIRESSEPSATNSAVDLLKQGAACNVWFLGSIEMESLTGHQAVQKAASMSLAMEPPPTSTVVHFKVSAQGITLTDNQRKLFFRRHYAVHTVIFCALDPQDRKWTRDGCTSAKIFGFVARKTGSGTENVCHLFAEHDPEQPASAIVNFVSKVMIGSLKNK